MGGGGGGGGGFSAQGAPPGFDYSTAMGLQQLAIGGDIQSYALSDQDFANRYPGLQDAYNQWQANLGPQVSQAAQGAAGQGQIMGGLGSQILGRQGTQTTGDINAVRNAAATAAGAAQPIMNLAGQQAGLAQPIFNLGQQQAGLAGGLVGMGGQIAGLGGRQAGIGAGINRMGGQLAGAAQIPYQLGQQLLQEPIDPLTQQQMMRAGLGSASGALGAASLGQGMAGQAAAARQLGLNTLQYGQAMRGEAMGDINQYASMLGAAGQMRGLGAQTIGAGGQTMGLGGQTIGLGGQQLTAGGALMGAAGQQLAGAGGLYGQGAQTAATAGGLSGAAQGLQEAYGMNTAQMAQIYGGLQNQQAAQQLGAIGTAGQLFQKRPFGLGGSNLAQAELGQTGAYNSFQQANYATMNGIAFNQAQMQAQQQQLGAQQSAGMVSAGVGAAGAAASAAAAASVCWVARACLGTADSRWKQFRLWLINYAPLSLRILYLHHGKAFAGFLARKPLLKSLVRYLMVALLETQQKSSRLLSLNNLLSA
jgi:hypothetical protein